MDTGQLTPQAWRTFLQLLRSYLRSLSFGETQDPLLFSLPDDSNSLFYLCPLHLLLYPKHLDLLDIHTSIRLFSYYAQADYTIPIIFLIAHPCEYLSKSNSDLHDDYLRQFLGNPDFPNTSKGILNGELIPGRYPECRSAWSCEYGQQCPAFTACSRISFCNLIFIDDFLPQRYGNPFPAYWRIRRCIDKSRGLASLRKGFYRSFVHFYNLHLQSSQEATELRAQVINQLGLTSLDLREAYFAEDTHLLQILKRSEQLYCLLNCLSYDSALHRSKHELFRAPVPFRLSDLIHSMRFVEAAHSGAAEKFRLLLLDNRCDKIVLGGSPDSSSNSIPELLRKYGLDRFFEVSMLPSCGIDEYRSDYTYDGVECCDVGYTFDAEAFRRFDEYKEMVVTAISSSDLVLLDFFLDSSDTYLAFDFIKDLSEYKASHNSFQTDWFFITSAMRDSAMKFSGSGLLAEYYESAVVCSGDDPTNPTREIIFIYKLMTFFQSRLMQYRLVLTWCVEGCSKSDQCREQSDRCLSNALYILRKCVTDHRDLTNLFVPGCDSILPVLEDIARLIRDYLSHRCQGRFINDCSVLLSEIDEGLKDCLGDESHFWCHKIRSAILGRTKNARS